MRYTTLCLVVSLVMVGCGGGGGGGGGGDDAGPNLTRLYVDVANGSDANPGTLALPFQSITHAISQRGEYTFIGVLPGIYAQLETYPIVIPDGLTLIGDAANKGAQTILRGAGPYANDTSIWSAVVVRGKNAGLIGFSVEFPVAAPQGTTGYGVFMDVPANADPLSPGENAYVNYSTIDGNPAHGVGVRGTGYHYGVSDNRIRNNIGTGVVMLPGIYELRLAESELRGNFVGLHVMAGTLGITDQTVFTDNTLADVSSEPNMVIELVRCFWDHVPPSVSTTVLGGGVDIYNPAGSATIDVLAPMLAP